MAAPASFNLACASTTPGGSGAYAGMLVWTVTAPWGVCTHPNFYQAVQEVMDKGSAKMAAYLINSAATSANEVPL
jgi:hypothetical protein